MMLKFLCLNFFCCTIVLDSRCLRELNVMRSELGLGMMGNGR
jgi:hypothetical protein